MNNALKAPFLPELLRVSFVAKITYSIGNLAN